MWLTVLIEIFEIEMLPNEQSFHIFLFSLEHCVLAEVL